MIKEFDSWMEIPLQHRNEIESQLKANQNGDSAPISEFSIQGIFDNGGVIVKFKDGKYVFLESGHYTTEDFNHVSVKFVECVYVVNGKAFTSTARKGRIERVYEDITLDEAEPQKGRVKRGMRGYRGDHRSATRGIRLLRKVLGNYYIDPRFRKRNS